ncbi:hypothetical protein BTH42_29860 [Burkholderia sp. SRS-W-2-2016]|uniref:LssY C-terminal domain-containing protein n=1 Tax=Burkholderia sp. SRS-W-2-2016 TaxID=1926878 RepID=UPI00094AB7FD|nr:LssY C-terminal domain-containing protein [Burkholderia sp. SRS-W-2-2016]OLL27996.1 hypothetical protein BTH42_29860 [Burkholderia sp. SRS-W-2-2016]
MFARPLGALVVACAVTACVAPASTTPASDYRTRAATRSENGIRVSAAALSSDESAAAYGVALASKGVQPVWIEVRNDTDVSYFLLSPGIDPDFFAASEVAEAFAQHGHRERAAEPDARFRELAFHNPVLPGRTTSGFVLTQLREGVKVVQVDLVASRRALTMPLFVTVPGFQADYKTSEVFMRELYPRESIVDYTDDEALRTALEALPCCTSNEGGTKNGDPLNLVIVGGLDDAFPALVRRGWTPTEEKWTGAIMRMVSAALAGEPYVNAPVSDLYLFGRPQDLALQKARDTIHERNHLRLWLSPFRYHGKPVWVGQISRDIGVRLTIHTPTFTTHKIDPDVDEARSALTEDMAYSQSLMKLGLVKGGPVAPPDAPRENLTTDPYYTDGYRMVLVFDQKPTSLAGIVFFPWHTSAARDSSRAGADR